MTVCSIAAPIAVSLTRGQLFLTIPVIVVGYMTVGFGFGISLVTKAVAMALAVDEDQVNRYDPQGGAIPPRRDGIFATVYMATFLAGNFGKGFALIALGLSGFEPSTAEGVSPDEQPPSVAWCIWFLMV